MKTFLLMLFVCCISFIACNKDKFMSIPQVKIKNISPSDTVRNGDIIRLNAEFTDDEGDLDSVLIVYKWYNGSTEILPFDTIRYTLAGLKIPVETREAEISIEFAYNQNIPGYVILSGVTRDTTATFGLVLVDKMLQRSNYEESKKIRLKKT